jgi:hypothetical protein
MDKLNGYAIKHIVKNRGLLDLEKQPRAFTSKPQARDAVANRCCIYIIEVHRNKRLTSYKLGCKFLATECQENPEGKWEGKYEYKITSEKPACGLYFGSPVLINDEEFNEWFRRIQGMIKIPPEYIKTLESIFSNPSNGAKPFV